MWILYLNGNAVLVHEDHDSLVAYLEVYVPGTYHAEIDRIEDPRVLAAIAPAQAAWSSLS